MAPVSTSIYLSCITYLVHADWMFQWPYAPDGSCKCMDEPSFTDSGEELVVGGAGFPTETQCLEAFANSEYETCSYKNQSVNEAQCASSVTVTPGFTNSFCLGRCTQVVAGVLGVQDLSKDCSFEFVVDFDDSVATLPNSCFNNIVYGWSDYDPSQGIQAAPLRVFEDVNSAASCQELCQDVPECVHFTWRALPDSVDNLPPVVTQNAPKTCILHSKEYMETVLNTDVSTLLFANEYCNIAQVGGCAGTHFPRANANLFSDSDCLICGCIPRCVWNSPYHVSGPAFCQPEIDLCKYERPIWTTTTPSPCPTETCQENPSVSLTETTQSSATESQENTATLSSPSAASSTGPLASTESSPTTISLDTFSVSSTALAPSPATTASRTTPEQVLTEVGPPLTFMTPREGSELATSASTSTTQRDVTVTDDGRVETRPFTFISTTEGATEEFTVTSTTNEVSVSAAGSVESSATTTEEMTTDIATAESDTALVSTTSSLTSISSEITSTDSSTETTVLLTTETGTTISLDTDAVETSSAATATKSAETSLTHRTEKTTTGAEGEGECPCFEEDECEDECVEDEVECLDC